MLFNVLVGDRTGKSITYRVGLDVAAHGPEDSGARTLGKAALIVAIVAAGLALVGALRRPLPLAAAAARTAVARSSAGVRLTIRAALSAVRERRPRLRVLPRRRRGRRRRGRRRPSVRRSSSSSTRRAAEGVRIERVLETHTHADHVSGHGRLALEHGLPVAIHPLAEPEFPFEPLADGQVIAGRRRDGPRPAHAGPPARALRVRRRRPDRADRRLAVRRRRRAPRSRGRGARGRRGSLPLARTARRARARRRGLSRARRRLALRRQHEQRPLARRSAASARRTARSRSATCRSSCSSRRPCPPPRPPTTERVVALNRGPWVARPDDPPELAEPGEATVLDVRPFADHAAGHVPGSISVPVDGGSFGTKAGFVLVAGERVVLHASSSDEALEAAAQALGGRHPRGRRLRHVRLPRRRRSRRSMPRSCGGCSTQPEVQVVDVREATERDERLPAGLDATSRTGCCASSAAARSSATDRS